MTDRKFYSGTSLDQAWMKASRDLDIPKEDLAYKQIEKKHGFLKMRRSVLIEVDPQSPRRTLSDEEALRRAQSIEPEVPAAPPRRVDPPPSEERPASSAPAPSAPAPRGPAPSAPASSAAAPSTPSRSEPARSSEERAETRAPRPSTAEEPRAEGEVADALREGLEMLLELAGVEMESSITQGDERYEIELWGPDQDRLLRDHGRPLLSLQHLLVRVVRGLTGEAVYCRVDCDQFHDIREERLRDLAQRIASEVANQGRSRLLESMAPDERRIVHITLADDPSVDTLSLGDGYFKRIKVFPA